MRWMDRIREDSLARVKSVCACGCGLSLCGVRSRFCSCRWDFQQRKVLDLSGPGELGVGERGICLRAGDLRERHGNKCDVPESRSKDCAARQAALDPDILEKTCGEKVFGEA